ncbi:toxin-activating lysine-acyltransferase [Nitratireductor pacificus]|uniref:RTX toxin-activating lysine-acyltransferase n=1 Tax=Nitratireductor pacificus pht-3B TaxID=391937 RepID=K2MJY7_9HYPH|nr:toxin-activating lysine-acyltransferase [Nitratireductor pacificus]EKF17517.1 apxIC gene product hemolysin activation protein [Nitratireductor pacificus pht-3B]
MSDIDLYAGIGYALELLARSDYHRAFPASPYIAVEILPPLNRGQFRFYLADDHVPQGMVTWAWLDGAVEEEILQTCRALHAHEWNCGPCLFINDFIAPHGNSRAVIHDLKSCGFLTERVSGIRRHRDGSLRCVKNSRVRLGQPPGSRQSSKTMR